jgi:hypothetical protein
MSSVIHPVGPEPEQTYWRRRLVVVAAAVLLVALVIALVIGGTSTGSAVSAAPSPSPVLVPPAVPVTPTPLTPSPSPSPSPSASESGQTSATPSPSPSGPASARDRTAAPTPSAKPAKPTKRAPVACSPKDLRATLTGKQQLKPKQPTTFALSLINGSGATCVVTVTPTTFELKIYSGTDRIWSSHDCSTAVKSRSVTLEAEDAVAWSMRWDGRRSRKDCKTRPEVPRPGTYFATAQLDRAKPVQLRLVLRG